MGGDDRRGLVVVLMIKRKRKKKITYEEFQFQEVGQRGHNVPEKIASDFLIH